MPKTIKESLSDQVMNSIFEDEDDPCWKGYTAFGTKDKNGKKVPNCVPDEKKEEMKEITGI